MTEKLKKQPSKQTKQIFYIQKYVIIVCLYMSLMLKNALAAEPCESDIIPPSSTLVLKAQKDLKEASDTSHTGTPKSLDGALDYLNKQSAILPSLTHFEYMPSPTTAPFTLWPQKPQERGIALTGNFGHATILDEKGHPVTGKKPVTRVGKPVTHFLLVTILPKATQGTILNGYDAPLPRKVSNDSGYSENASLNNLTEPAQKELLANERHVYFNPNSTVIYFKPEHSTDLCDADLAHDSESENNDTPVHSADTWEDPGYVQAGILPASHLYEEESPPSPIPGVARTTTKELEQLDQFIDSEEKSGREKLHSKKQSSSPLTERKNHPPVEQMTKEDVKNFYTLLRCLKSRGLRWEQIWGESNNLSPSSLTRSPSSSSSGLVSLPNNSNDKSHPIDANQAQRYLEKLPTITLSAEKKQTSGEEPVSVFHIVDATPRRTS